MYKILIDRAFTEDEDSPFEKIEPHKKFNTQWGTIYYRDLDPYIIIGGKDQLYVKGVYSSDTQKSTAEATQNSLQTAQINCMRDRMQDCRGNLCLCCFKEPHKTGDKKICGDYKMRRKTERDKKRKIYRQISGASKLGGEIIP